MQNVIVIIEKFKNTESGHLCLVVILRKYTGNINRSLPCF